MILVPRPPGSAPDVLEKDGEAGWRERKKALEYFLPGLAKAPAARSVLQKPVRKVGKVRKGAKAKVAREKPTKPAFVVYKHKLVKRALASMFHDKCAYCELKYLAGQPGDIDHWRPKGRVAESRALANGSRPHSRVHPGYWWLAASWENLLPTCTECNRPRSDEETDQERVVRRGKADQFPLADESRRAFTSGEIDQEQPLLLDPTIDDPEKFLAFNDQAEIEALGDDPRGIATIRILGLDRLHLTLRRHDALAILHIFKNDVQNLAIELQKQDLSEDQREKFRRDLRTKLALLNRAIQPEAEFSAMARCSIVPFLKSIAPQLEPLLRELTAPDKEVAPVTSGGSMGGPGEN